MIVEVNQSISQVYPKIQVILVPVSPGIHERDPDKKYSFSLVNDTLKDWILRNLHTVATPDKGNPVREGPGEK